MKIDIFSGVLSFSLLVIFAGCGKDNYDAPESVLSGRVVYEGQALDLRGSGEKVKLQLYQDGYQRHDPINVYVGQDGAFSAKLFDGKYKLVTADRTGPWVNSRDTMIVNVKGATTIDVPVIPFFTVSNASVSLVNNEMKTTFTINKIVPEAEIDRVILLLNSTVFVDDQINIMRKDFTDNVSPGTVNLSADLTGNTTVSSAPVLYGRVCVWAKGADQGIYSPVVRLK
ncbi:DUF3823 domain-containing protein [Pararcticibacter amylolyticus]|uniref:DUF3823 domain-containing protein n=1 Tax=Pararcticibacter amylolyticus TaxID=2173175 RepID=A0A2U2PLG7_9SPHI|nr:DUF3823 domain-containing protein [Pararcticibacter amylolyticus]PWG82253.1 hypothetical protein DDR33_04385 [Pararcticibacter amylolyticus]